MRTYIALAVFLFVLSAPPVAAQDREFDAESFSLPKTGIDSIGSLDELSGGNVLREIKYTAGKDAKWFTSDDAIYHFFTADYDGKGRMVKKTCLKPGDDGRPYTGDDEVQDYQLYLIGKGGRGSGERSYNGPGQDGIWFTADDALKYSAVMFFSRRGSKEREERRDGAGRIIRVLTFTCDPAGRVTRDVEYSGPGPDGKWVTGDDEIEKYHTREYGADGKLLRVSEFHRDFAGRGTDAKWFSSDDVVSSTKNFIYGPQGRVEKLLKCVAPGPDGAWFTGDDTLQYYTVRSY